jgi:hypothetical protein
LTEATERLRAITGLSRSARTSLEPQLYTTALTLALLAAPAPALAPRWNPKAPDNAQILPAFSYATVEPVLTSIGARFQRVGTSPARPQLNVTFPNNRKAMLVMSACDPAGTACKAMSVQSYWTRIANSPPDRTARAIETFNQRYAFAKAFVAADGRPALQRYLTADYGFVRGNLAVNLLVFASQSDQFATQVLRPLEAAK